MQPSYSPLRNLGCPLTVHHTHAEARIMTGPTLWIHRSYHLSQLLISSRERSSCISDPPALVRFQIPDLTLGPRLLHEPRDRGSRAGAWTGQSQNSGVQISVSVAQLHRRLRVLSWGLHCHPLVSIHTSTAVHSETCGLRTSKWWRNCVTHRTITSMLSERSRGYDSLSRVDSRPGRRLCQPCPVSLLACLNDRFHTCPAVSLPAIHQTFQ